MPERLKAILDKITAWWKKFNTKQRSVLISIVAVVIVALVILGVVISRPTQVELVEAQSASEASTIKGVLEDNNIEQGAANDSRQQESTNSYNGSNSSDSGIDSDMMQDRVEERLVTQIMRDNGNSVDFTA